MLIAFVAAAHERDRALRLANWIEELGAGKGHDVLLAVTQAAVHRGLAAELEPVLRRAFDSFSLMVPFDSVEVPWGAPGWDASSANHLFTRVNRHIQQHFNRPYLHLEMDALPARATAFAELETEYKAGGKPFMGDRVENGRHPIHMSGVAIYPADVIGNSKLLGAIDWNCYPMPASKRKLAWDIAAAPEVVPKAHFTPLIQHAYQYTPECHAVELYNGSAALFHQCKCGCLIERLRKEPQISKAASEVIQSETDIGGVYGMQEYPGNTIFTYFQPLTSIDANEQLLLIDLWRYSWRKAGWNPLVLHGKRFGGIAGTLTKLPSVNPVGYDAACFVRWLAMAEHGGWMSDYDCMNNGLPPQPIPKRLTVCQTNNACPSLVGGDALEFLRIARLFSERGPALIGEINGRPHVSDMHILQAMPEEFDQQEIVLGYGAHGWNAAPAIHFANSTMEGKQPRSLWIPRLVWGQDKPPIESPVDQHKNGKRPVSDEQKEKLRANLAKAREVRARNRRLELL
jgi:hypothetical protein